MKQPKILEQYVDSIEHQLLPTSTYEVKYVELTMDPLNRSLLNPVD
ncbi:MAG: hypothetical protein JSY10_12965 [Paenibacillus sp.]|nr:hypothetical protein [Paenibacillus sp.]